MNLNYSKTDFSSKNRQLSVQEWMELNSKHIYIPMNTLLQGNSMEPLIRRNKDEVTILPIQILGRDLLPGDIVLFKRHDGAYVVHRVYKVDSKSGIVQTWGDNCKYPDKPISLDSVLGYITAYKRNNKIVTLNSEEQRAYGVRCMRNSLRRSLNITYTAIREKMLYHLGYRR